MAPEPVPSTNYFNCLPRWFASNVFFFFFPHFLFASQTQFSLPARIIISIMGVMCGVFLKRWEKKSLYPNVLLNCNRAGSLLWESNIHTPVRAKIAVMHQCPFGFPLTWFDFSWLWHDTENKTVSPSSCRSGGEKPEYIHRFLFISPKCDSQNAAAFFF